MADVRAIGKQLGFQFIQHTAGRAWFLRQRFGKQLIHRPRLNIGEHSFFFDMIKIIGQQIHNSVAQFAKLFSIHAESPEFSLIARQRRHTPVLALKLRQSLA